jgi:hypothetical protein
MNRRSPSQPDQSPASRNPQPAAGRLRRLTGDRRVRLSLAIIGAVAVLAGALSAVVFDGPTSRWATERSAQTNAAPAQVPATVESASPSSAAPSQSPSKRPSASVGPAGRGANGTWPGPGNTGVPAGVKLRPSGEITVTKDGTVIDGVDVNGCIIVKANHVTIRHTRVRASCDSGSISTPDSTNAANVVIEDTEIDGLNQRVDVAGVSYSGFTCRRCNIHHTGTGMRFGHDARVEDSWLHDMNAGGISHNNAIAGHGAVNLTVLRNRLECLNVDHCTAALALFYETEVHDVLVQGNIFSGGGYCVYGGADRSGRTGHNLRFIGNAFSTSPYAKCGQYGPVAYWQAGQGNEWTGNYWNDAAKTPVDSNG